MPVAENRNRTRYRFGAARPAGFTLVELLVAVAIIALLLGILLAVRKAIETSESARTEAQVQQCEVLLSELRTITGIQQVRDADVNGNNHMGALLQRAARTEQLAELMSALGDKYDSTGFVLLDHWDRPIFFNYNGANASPVNRPNSEGGGPIGHDMPVRDYPYFASAGADGLWGDWDNSENKPNPNVDDDQNGRADSADNIYSFNITAR